MALKDQISTDIDALRTAGLWRAPRQVTGPQGPEITVDGKQVLCLSSNNYLGLANHPELIKAATETFQTEGVGSGASRLITGSMSAHLELESALASYLIHSEAILFSSGYAANVGTLQALANKDDLILSDRLNHASLIDGARLSRAHVEVYEHVDCEHVRVLLQEHRARFRRAFVVSDGLFSMDGDRAPVSTLRKLADEFDASLIVDEAHALGVLGPEGRGVCAEQGVKSDVMIGTLGKSFGASGAFAATDSSVAQFLRNRARSFVFSTSPPPAIAAAATAALSLVKAGNDRRATLLRHASTLRRSLQEQGYDVPDEDSQIIAVHIGDASKTMKLSNTLFEKNVLAQGIRPPTVPEGTSRIRLVPMATHTDSQIEKVIEAFAALKSS